VGGESCFDKHAVSVRPEGAESVGFALLTMVASSARALTRGPRLLGGVRMRVPSFFLLYLGRDFRGTGELDASWAGLPVCLMSDGCYS
jgi:hypothetical protein